MKHLWSEFYRSPAGAPAAGETAAGPSVQARIDEIRRIMSTDYPKYKRDGLDGEYAQLLEGQRQETR